MAGIRCSAARAPGDLGGPLAVRERHQDALEALDRPLSMSATVRPIVSVAGAPPGGRRCPGDIGRRDVASQTLWVADVNGSTTEGARPAPRRPAPGADDQEQIG